MDGRVERWVTPIFLLRLDILLAKVAVILRLLDIAVVIVIINLVWANCFNIQDANLRVRNIAVMAEGSPWWLLLREWFILGLMEALSHDLRLSQWLIWSSRIFCIMNLRYVGKFLFRRWYLSPNGSRSVKSFAWSLWSRSWPAVLHLPLSMNWAWPLWLTSIPTCQSTVIATHVLLYFTIRQIFR